TSSSGVVPAQSVKSGNVEGFSKPIVVSGAPLPSGPWHPAQPALKIASPLVRLRAARGCASCAAEGEETAMNAVVMISVARTMRRSNLMARTAADFQDVKFITEFNS